MTGMLHGTPASDPWKAFSATLAEKAEETPGVATYRLELTDPEVVDSYDFRPGQFNMLYLPGVGEAAISVSGRAAADNGLLHTVRRAGNVTGTLDRLSEGSSLGIRGPFGSSWPLEDCRRRNVIIVAGGIGLAPLRPAVEAVLTRADQYGRLTILVGARSAEHLLYHYEYPEWRSRGAVVEMTVDRSSPGWQGHVGVVPLLLDRMDLPEPENTVVFVCGPEVMMSYTVKSALRRGISPQRIWLNLERNMNCAIGLCGHCQFGPQFICKDGPILRYDVLEPFLPVKDL